MINKSQGMLSFRDLQCKWLQKKSERNDQGKFHTLHVKKQRA